MSRTVPTSRTRTGTRTGKPRPIAFYRIARAALSGSCALPRGARVLVACSGGPDSLALLHVLHELSRPFRLSLVVAHLDHGVRGRAARADARFVEREAEKLGLPFVTDRIDREPGAGAGVSEDTLRRERSSFLARAARQAKADAVALGHTADDQAETVLLRLVRGTGVLGLAAMRPRRGRLIRPLLLATRGDVLDFIRERRLVPRQDATNRDRAYRRNFVRLEILPRLAHLNPQIARSLTALAGRVAGLSDWLQQEAAQALEEAAAGSPRGQIRLVARKLLRYHPLVREAAFTQAFRHLAGPGAGLTRRHLDALGALVGTRREGASVDLPGALTARMSGGRVCFSATRVRRGRAPKGA